ncbi:hypothetical protein P4S93_18295 [Aneurinibacillus thermoaerophilus]|uniref:hypothetical protein n=1 Tax=Aneurinibacillus thermoaerophilus TaxID=143495 RepID=UPI002E20BDDD|nr:hypothetical protein [Aneurinibacillus thermoaerophilus]MED0762668.1 hypothetical protein [Aneurinibacillus thermoaerophilus]
MLEIKSYRWQERGEKYAADFFPFVDGEPRHDLNCGDCIHYIEGGDCKKVQEEGEDDLCYPFCGPICGKFQMEDEQ